MGRESDVVEAAPSEPTRLARHDRLRMARRPEAIDDLDYHVVAARQPVMIRELVLAILRDERIHFHIVARVLAEHRGQWSADSGEPFGIARHVTHAILKGVARGIEYQLDGI